MLFLTREKSLIRLDLKALKFDSKILSEVARIGVPAGIQGMVFSLSNVCIQGALNTFGSVAVAGSSAALNFEYYTYYVLNAYSQTCTTFVSQNMGADNLKRCKSIVIRTAVMCAVSVIMVSSVFLLFDGVFLSIFTTEAEVMKYGFVRMHVILGFQVINGMLEVFSGAMRGMGHSLTPAVITVVGVCGLRLVYVFIIFKIMGIGTFISLLAVYPISWIITASSIVLAFVLTYRKKVREGVTLA